MAAAAPPRSGARGSVSGPAAVAPPRSGARGGEAGHAAAAPPRSGARGGEAGQATVEVVALLPVLAVVLAAAWQAALAGHAAWAATTAARAAARAHAVGADPGRAARIHLPAPLEQGLRVKAGSDGDVEVAVRIPSLPGLPSLGHAHAAAHFEPQS
jgi:hypothetical protein